MPIALHNNYLTSYTPNGIKTDSVCRYIGKHKFAGLWDAVPGAAISKYMSPFLLLLR